MAAGTRDGSIPGPGRLWALAGETAAATPPSRDRVVDLLRAGSLTVVVLGHMLMAVVVWPAGRAPRIDNLLAVVPAAQALTWALQVMPLFFVAGGIANRRSWLGAAERGEPWSSWLWHRLVRLCRPVVVYLAIWVPLVLVLQALLGEHVAAPLARISTQLLWFLGVYVLVVAITPVSVGLARRAPIASVAVLLGVVAVVDLVRFGADNDAVALLNFVLVWWLCAQLGLVVADGLVSRAAWVLVAVAGVGINLALVALGPWPGSMVGLPGDRISNMAPPTLVLAMHAVVVTAVVAAAWPAIDRFAHRARVWQATVLLGGVAMTLYLWHLTALVLLTVLEHALGILRPRPPSWVFWAGTLPHLVAALVITAGLVVLFAPFEHRPLPWVERPIRHAARPALAGIGTFLLGAGFLSLSATGMAGFPWSRVRHYAGLPLTPALGFSLIALGMLAARAGAGPAAGRVEPPVATS